MVENILLGWIEGIINMADFFPKEKNYIPTRQVIISNISKKNVVVVT